MNSAAPGKPGFTTTQWLVCIIASIGFAFDIYELLMLPLIIKPAIAALSVPLIEELKLTRLAVVIVKADSQRLRRVAAPQPSGLSDHIAAIVDFLADQVDDCLHAGSDSRRRADSGSSTPTSRASR